MADISPRSSRLANLSGCLRPERDGGGVFELHDSVSEKLVTAVAPEARGPFRTAAMQTVFIRIAGRGCWTGWLFAWSMILKNSGPATRDQSNSPAACPGARLPRFRTDFLTNDFFSSFLSSNDIGCITKPLGFLVSHSPSKYHVAAVLRSCSLFMSFKAEARNSNQQSWDPRLLP